jgi:hypothetical protein
MILYRGDGASPENFTPVCEAFGISGIGEANDQIDATDFCSGGAKEYIAGLSDGSEITLELNFVASVAAAAQMAIQAAFIADVKNKVQRDFQLRCDGDADGVTDLTFHWTATALSWTLNPNPTAKNAISFGLKISGGVDITAP